MGVYSSRLWEKELVCVLTTNLSSQMFKALHYASARGAAESGRGWGGENCDMFLKRYVSQKRSFRISSCFLSSHEDGNLLWFLRTGKISHRVGSVFWVAIWRTSCCSLCSLTLSQQWRGVGWRQAVIEKVQQPQSGVCSIREETSLTSLLFFNMSTRALPPCSDCTLLEWTYLNVEC